MTEFAVWQEPKKRLVKMENKVGVKVAENCGFCFGVRRAVDTVYKLRKKTNKKSPKIKLDFFIIYSFLLSEK